MAAPLYRCSFTVLKTSIQSASRRVRLKRNLTGSATTEPLLTIKQVRKRLQSIVGAPELWSLSADPVSPVVSPSVMTPPDPEVYTRHAKDSYCEAIIPLGSDKIIQDKYLNFYKGIRFGKILEDLDTFAVWVSYMHNMNPNLGPDQKSVISLVTALVDRIELQDNAILPDKDIKMKGNVTWVGKTSIEATMTLEQYVNGIWNQLMLARFVMVAVNPITKKSALVNSLLPQGEDEERLFQLGQRNKIKRQDDSRKSLLKTPPNEQERIDIHEMFLSTLDPSKTSFSARIKPDNSVWMENTLLKTLAICQPQERNLYNKIFGGFLMCRAFELGWANAALYCKTRPHIQVVDDIIFRRPVPIGSLLFFSSEVVYTIGSKLQVKVHAEVVDPKDGSHDTTNIFHFTFDTKKDNVPKVIPKTYAESMMFLDGKRHFVS